MKTKSFVKTCVQEDVWSLDFSYILWHQWLTLLLNILYLKVYWICWSWSLTGFPKLISPKAKASKTLFRPMKPTNPSVRMAYKGQSSFRKPAVTFINMIKMIKITYNLIYDEMCIDITGDNTIGLAVNVTLVKECHGTRVIKSPWKTNRMYLIR